MTNGGAKLADEADQLTRDQCFERLTTRDPTIACSSGQWMTERTGSFLSFFPSFFRSFLLFLLSLFSCFIVSSFDSIGVVMQLTFCDFCV